MKGLLKNRYFILSFSLSLIIIFFFAAIFYVDFMNRTILFGDSTPSLSVFDMGESKLLNLRFLGIDKTFDITGIYLVLKAIFDFICIPL